eukprot:9790600-Karenia_brevis.AAC.1
MQKAPAYRCKSAPHVTDASNNLRDHRRANACTSAHMLVTFRYPNTDVFPVAARKFDTRMQFGKH